MDIAAAVGAERLREIMAELVERSTAVVHRYGGTVDKFTGDGIMAVFGAPIAMEDHAVRACLAALGIQEQAESVAVDVHDRDGIELRLRVGLNSGQVIAGEIGSEAEAVIGRLASAQGDDSQAREIWLLRLRALLARAKGENASYRDYRDRYRTMATSLGFEGHMKWAEAMP